MIAGPTSPRHGEAKNSWLTGTAAWAFVAVSQHILGIRADFDGLVIDPCASAELGGYTVTREFRGARYTIEVRDPGEGRSGRLSVDGRPVAGNTVPAAPEGTEIHVLWEGQAG
jgi:cellobiose phosphorylase